MTKIILAFPCMGKTYFAKYHPTLALDLESSDYLFDKCGFEHLSKERFKGLANRKRNPNGLNDYLTAIDKAMKSEQYEYIFTSQSPDVVKGIIHLGYDVIYIKPAPTNKAREIFVERALKRGNNQDWITSTVKFLEPLPYDDFTTEEQKHIEVRLVAPHLYLSDILL